MKLLLMAVILAAVAMIPAPRHKAAHHARPRAALQIPAHLTDADYLQYGAEITNDPSVYAPYLTYAYAKGDRYKITHNAGIKTVLYTNPMMPVKNEIPYPWLAPGGIYNVAAGKDCLGNQITSYAGSGWLANLLAANSTPGYVAAAEQQYVITYAGYNGGDYVDAFFIDNSNDIYGTNTQPCNWSASKWTAGFVAATAGMTKPTFANALAVPAAYVNPPPGVTPANQVAGLASVTGGEYEGCYGVHNGILKNPYWTPVLTTQLLTEQSGKVFWCYADETAAASSATADRIYVLASFLLGYNPDPSSYIIQNAYATPDYFKVLPEYELVPTLPAIDPTNPATTPQTYLQASGAYQNLFAQCYYAGQTIGGCQVDVNPSASSISVSLNPTQSCMVAVSGNDVLGGGTLTMNTPASSTLASGTAAIYVGCRSGGALRRKHGKH